MKKRLNLTIIVIFLALGIHVANAQRIIGAPSLTSGAQACGTLSNSFDFVAELSPGTALPASNVFILELSDPTGSFANGGEELLSVSGPNEASGGPSNINFTNVAVPQNANSDDYRLRVTATEGNVTNTISEPIPFHFFDDDNLEVILNGRDDVIFCRVASFAKEITVEVTDLDDNVFDANNFNWEWLKDDVIIPGENSPTLLITEVGEYQARVQVGLCNNVFRFNKSNKVDASIINVGDISIVTDAPDFSFCPDEDKILSASANIVDGRYEYQWFKDGEALEGEIASTIVLPDNNFGGEYTLRINISEDCQDLETQPVVVTNEGSSITLPLPESLILLPTQTLTLVVETDVPAGSTFRWIVDTSIQTQGITVSDSETLTFSAPFVGDYRIEIEANDPCNSMLFSETSVFAAERFDITIAPEEVVDCEQDPITIALTEMVGITSGGERVPLTTEQFDFFDFEWFNDGVSTGETSLSLNVSRSDSGGSFELRAIFRPGGLPNTVSNNLPIDFLSSDIVLDITPPVLQAGESVVLTAPLNANFTYEWYVIQNGEEVLIEGETSNTLTVTEEGDYFAIISSSLCTTRTQIASVGGPQALSELIPNVITPGGNAANNDWVLPNSFRETDVEVIIYSSNGKVDFQKNGGYNADWPTNSASQANELIYYYIISRSSTVVKKGTITVMR
ncbi:gliding motility-associated C-terminal domain-containing protein [uncultured Aquimarina sp.]|uniref:T9SS type B sorting domain-containing protein n=1 Tax=uncultured Aquimarina sp. TaxID=575652 RepID=UPI002638D184|nr:gliding motility-associated C-terminal domain-containing protein [uncultured Aquimarina sp.]